jgi:polyhydroxyalkanoate synthesis regulator phasin
MQAKKASSRPISPLVSLTLKVVGIIITLSTLLDIIILAIPFQLTSRDWQIDFVTQLVDRGIVPLIGIVLFLTGFWIDSMAGAVGERRNMGRDPRFWALALSCLLGALFLIMFPLHLNNVRLAYQESAQGISQEAADAEAQLSSQIDSQLASQRQQINLLLSAPSEQVDQLVQQGRLSQEQADLINQFRNNPDQIEPYLEQGRGQLSQQAEELQTEIGVRREQAQQELKTRALRSGLRVGVSSLLLSIGFIVIGWLGLKTLRQL